MRPKSMIYRFPAIRKWLDNNEKTINELAAMTGMKYHELHDKLRWKSPMRLEEVDAILAATGMTLEEFREGEISKEEFIGANKERIEQEN